MAGCARAPRGQPPSSRRLAITIDDPATETAIFPPERIAAGILDALSARRLSSMLFVCGMRVDSPKGHALLSSWNDSGHAIANHSYSHRFFHDPKISVADMAADVDRCEKLISGYPRFARRFRYPFLKEGDTREKRDGMRAELLARRYAIGHVTIDTSDWAYDSRLVARLRRDSKADLGPFRSAYVAHMLDRARYYDRLGLEVIGRSIPHVVLMHHNVINSLFLGDLLDAYAADGWTVVSPAEAYADPIFAEAPETLPAGESLVWSHAQLDPRYRGKLRYPGEDDTYEAGTLDRLEPMPPAVQATP
jgi:peptidoglycan/xylan/chitin deacetylase (PgdA/CDA1 family)